MAILTPITLWQDFDDTLPPEEEILSEQEAGGIVLREVTFRGREVTPGGERVKIYAQYVFPYGAERFPVVLVLFEAGHPFDLDFAMRFVQDGYGVLMVDYCGERAEGRYTLYPKSVDYANLCRAGRALTHCDTTAKETSWYEWAAVARYAVSYLIPRKEVTAVGAVGLRTGGEVLFKVAPFVPLCCMVSVCAAGWLAYGGVNKYAEDNSFVLDEERHRFIAGIDSQSYAPHAKCPVLLISAVNDKKSNYERVYDTFRQINPAVEKALLFSTHGSGLVGSHSLKDIELFLGKYLKGRTVFLPKPAVVSAEADERGDLVVTGTFDPKGEIAEFGIFYTENVSAQRMRDWTRIMGRPEDLAGNTGKIALPLYAGTKRALVYAFVSYSNNLSVTSKILEINVEKPYANAVPRARVLYGNGDGKNGFTPYRSRSVIADCFSEGSSTAQVAGYGGILGVSATPGIISYRGGGKVRAARGGFLPLRRLQPCGREAARHLLQGRRREDGLFGRGHPPARRSLAEHPLRCLRLQDGDGHLPRRLRRRRLRGLYE